MTSQRFWSRAAVGGACVLVTAVVVAALATPGSAAAGSDATAIATLVGDAQQQLDVIEGVNTASGSTNSLRGFGALVGLALGIVIGSVGTYVKWRR